MRTTLPPNGVFLQMEVLRIGSLSILNKPLPILPIRSYRFVMLPFNFSLIMTGPTDTPIFPRKSRIDIYMLSRKFQLIDHASIVKFWDLDFEPSEKTRGGQAMALLGVRICHRF